MGKDVFTGKASSQTMEKLHGQVASIYDKALDGLETAHANKQRYEEQMAEEEDRDVNDVPFSLSKDDLALLSNATKFLKDNSVEMDVQKKSGSKKFSSKVQELNRKKRQEAIEFQ